MFRVPSPFKVTTFVVERNGKNKQTLYYKSRRVDGKVVEVDCRIYVFVGDEFKIKPIEPEELQAAKLELGGITK
jgi:hypothetical protein